MVVKKDKVPYEDALNMTGFGKYNLLMFVVNASVILGMTFEMYSVSYLVPGSACELNTSSTQQGLMAGVPMIGIILTSHFWGYLADTRGRKKILTLSMTLSFVAGALAAFSPNWIVLSVFKFISSAAGAGAYAVAMTLLSESTPGEKRSLFVILTSSVFLSATGVMAVISIPVLPLTFSYYIPFLDIYFNSWRLLDLILCLPCAFGAVGVSCCYESPKYLMTMGKNDEALQNLKGIFKINSGKDQELYEANSLVLDEECATHGDGFWSSMLAQTLPMLRPPLLKTTLLIGALFFTVFISANPFIVWLPYIVNAFMISVQNDDRGMTICEMIRSSTNSSTIDDEPSTCSMDSFAMIMVFAAGIILAVLNIISSKAVVFVGRKNFVILVQLLSGVMALSINTLKIWYISAVFFVVYLFPIINFGFLTTYSVDIFPTYIKAMAVSVTLMVGRGSAVIGINILKSLLESNCETAFYVFGSIATCGGLFGLLLPSDAKIAEQKQKPKDVV